MSYDGLSHESVAITDIVDSRPSSRNGSRPASSQGIRSPLEGEQDHASADNGTFGTTTDAQDSFPTIDQLRARFNRAMPLDGFDGRVRFPSDVIDTIMHASRRQAYRPVALRGNITGVSVHQNKTMHTFDDLAAATEWLEEMLEDAIHAGIPQATRFVEWLETSPIQPYQRATRDRRTGTTRDARPTRSVLSDRQAAAPSTQSDTVSGNSTDEASPSSEVLEAERIQDSGDDAIVFVDLGNIQGFHVPDSRNYRWGQAGEENVVINSPGSKIGRF